jgi:hypothetical protein
MLQTRIGQEHPSSIVLLLCHFGKIERWAGVGFLGII